MTSSSCLPLYEQLYGTTGEELFLQDDEGTDDFRALIRKARHSWLKNEEIFQLLCHCLEYGLTAASEPPQCPPGGCLYLYDRTVVKYFRADGHPWRLKPNGTSIRETHERLKVEGEPRINCYYAHCDSSQLQRRSYWLLCSSSPLVLVHYLDSKKSKVLRGGAATGGQAGSSLAVPMKVAGHRNRKKAAATTDNSSESSDFLQGRGRRRAVATAKRAAAPKQQQRLHEHLQDAQQHLQQQISSSGSAGRMNVYAAKEPGSGTSVHNREEERGHGGMMQAGIQGLQRQGSATHSGGDKDPSSGSGKRSPQRNRAIVLHKRVEVDALRRRQSSKSPRRRASGSLSMDSESSGEVSCGDQRGGRTGWEVGAGRGGGSIRKVQHVREVLEEFLDFELDVNLVAGQAGIPAEPYGRAPVVAERVSGSVQALRLAPNTTHDMYGGLGGAGTDAWAAGLGPRARERSRLSLTGSQVRAAGSNPISWPLLAAGAGGAAGPGSGGLAGGGHPAIGPRSHQTPRRQPLALIPPQSASPQPDGQPNSGAVQSDGLHSGELPGYDILTSSECVLIKEEPGTQGGAPWQPPRSSSLASHIARMSIMDPGSPRHAATSSSGDNWAANVFAAATIKSPLSGSLSYERSSHSEPLTRQGSGKRLHSAAPSAHDRASALQAKQQWQHLLGVVPEQQPPPQLDLPHELASPLVNHLISNDKSSAERAASHLLKQQWQELLGIQQPKQEQDADMQISPTTRQRPQAQFTTQREALRPKPSFTFSQPAVHNASVPDLLSGVRQGAAQLDQRPASQMLREPSPPISSDLTAGAVSSPSHSGSLPSLSASSLQLQQQLGAPPASPRLEQVRRTSSRGGNRSSNSGPLTDLAPKPSLHKVTSLERRLQAARGAAVARQRPHSDSPHSGAPTSTERLPQPLALELMRSGSGLSSGSLPNTPGHPRSSSTCCSVSCGPLLSLGLSPQTSPLNTRTRSVELLLAGDLQLPLNSSAANHNHTGPGPGPGSQASLMGAGQDVSGIASGSYGVRPGLDSGQDPFQLENTPASAPVPRIHGMPPDLAFLMNGRSHSRRLSNAGHAPATHSQAQPPLMVLKPTEDMLLDELFSDPGAWAMLQEIDMVPYSSMVVDVAGAGAGAAAAMSAGHMQAPPHAPVQSALADGAAQGQQATWGATSQQGQQAPGSTAPGSTQNVQQWYMR